MALPKTFPLVIYFTLVYNACGNFTHCSLPIVTIFIYFKETSGLRCWICGTSAELYNTDPTDPNRENFDVGTMSWCSSMVTSATCKATTPGEEMLCYKEIWTVDGATSKLAKAWIFLTLKGFFLVVKRGCAKKDKRYDKVGCEEQLTGAGNFWLTLCLCKDSYCNSSTKLKLDWCLIAGLMTYFLSRLP